MEDLCLTGHQLHELMDAVLTTSPSNRVKVKGHGLSMSPFICNHNVIVLRPNSPDTKIGFGDIVAVFNKNKTKILIHRVIGRDKSKFLIKGDNNIRPDGWYLKQDILGIVDKIRGNKFGFKYTPWVNIPAAVGSRTGLFNRILFPVLKHLKKIILPHG